MLTRPETDTALFHAARLETLFAPVAGRESVALAVSGGPDSLALMAMAARWREQSTAGPRLLVLSVDHGLRTSSGEEVARVCELADTLGLEAVALKWEGEKPDSGLQAAARAARYRLMGEAMRRRGTDTLLTAHHMDDQAETILMRMAHGSGLTGLAGMTAFSTVHGVEVFRPFLGLRRRDLESVVAAMGWSPVEDPSNVDPAFERARWRQAMPQIEALGLTVERLAQAGTRLARADAVLRELTDEALGRLVRFDRFGMASAPVAGLMALAPAIRMRVLSRVIDAAGGAGRSPEMGQVEALAAALGSGATLAGTTLGGCQIAVRDGSVLVHREPGRLKTPTATLVPGATFEWDGRFTISSSPEAPALKVTPAREVTREQLAEWSAGSADGVPMAAVHAAPLVTGDGAILAVGALVRDPRVSVAVTMPGATGTNN